MLKLNLSNLFNALVLASILAIAGYVWGQGQKVEDLDKKVQVQAAKQEEQKEHTQTKLDNLEKKVDKTNEMVEKLLDIELAKASKK
jgi:uncharacterized protein HemX